MSARRVDRVERLTNLLALLLETSRPLTMVEIVGALAGQYPDGERNQRAAFERDKAALRDLGVPIEAKSELGQGSPGEYRIDRRAYELTDLELDGDERRALQVAVAAVRTDTSAGRDAMWKLGGSAIGEVGTVSAVMPDRPELPIVRAAVASRSLISFGYRSERRHIEPWGLLLRGGFWYVIGLDRDRGAQRTFASIGSTAHPMTSMSARRVHSSVPPHLTRATRSRQTPNRSVILQPRAPSPSCGSTPLVPPRLSAKSALIESSNDMVTAASMSRSLRQTWMPSDPGFSACSIMPWSSVRPKRAKAIVDWLSVVAAGSSR